MKIGIVIAMDKEFSRVRDLLTDPTDVEDERFICSTGRMGQNDMVLVQCGIGKVNSAVGTLEVIKRFSPDAIISTGVAGGVRTSLNQMEVVVAETTCYHDVYCGPESTYGQIPGQPSVFSCDADLVAKAMSLDCGVKINHGLIVTGDWFVDSREKMRSIEIAFPEAMAVDMESASIAHVCHIYKVPFISFRIISDIPLKDTESQMYNDFWGEMADNSFKVTQSFLKSI